MPPLLALLLFLKLQTPMHLENDNFLQKSDCYLALLHSGSGPKHPENEIHLTEKFVLSQQMYRDIEHLGYGHMEIWKYENMDI